MLPYITIKLLLNNNNNNKIDWYNCVYYCVENKNSKNSIDRFSYYKLQTIEEANIYYNYMKNCNRIVNYKESINQRHTIIYICKWIPNRFHSYYLNKKIESLFEKELSY